MFLVGLTGGIATGKSSVSKILKEFGAQVIDADIIAREVVEPGKSAWKKIKSEFGTEILKENGEIDRPKLGDVVFNDAKKRHRLDNIVHPEVDEESQLNRLMVRNGLGESDAKKRIKSQMPLEEKCKRANFVIDNSGDLESTTKELKLVYETIVRSRRHWRLRFLIFGWFAAIFTVFAWLTGYL